MNHLSEEDLVVLRYRDASDAPTLEAHLVDCAECRGRFEELERDLAALPELVAPERGPDYPAALWARLQPQLRAARPDETERTAETRAGQPAGPLRRPRLPGWAPYLALAASLVGAFWLGRQWPRPAGNEETIGAPVRERILLVAVGDHLDRSRMVLIELVNAGGDGEVDISAEKRAAKDLVETNRLYRQTAVRAGEAGVADVLEDLERVLTEVAASPSAVSAAELSSLRRRIEARGILFKVKVLSSGMREREKAFPSGAVS